MGYIRKLVGFLSIIIYIFIGIYAVVCLPILFKYNPLVVLTGSMEPTFKVGSVIYYRKVSQSELKEGDAITFKVKDDKFVSHRIVNIKNGLYETRGDANNISDVEKVSYNDIQGKDANICIPYVGYYVRFINENLRIILIPILVILISEFIFSNIVIDEKDKKKDQIKEEDKKKERRQEECEIEIL